MSSRESFYGFNMTDDEVGPGNRRDLAIEVKHIFEGIANEADEKNEEIFLAPELEHAVRRFVVDPCQASLDYLLEASPVLTDTFSELQALLNIVRGTPKDSENEASDTSGILDDCDLIAAAREMQETIAIGIAQAEEDGGIICCEIEFRQILESFIEHPTRQTAQALLDVAPTLGIVSLFTKHAPTLGADS